jgi:hypothetical protein
MPIPSKRIQVHGLNVTTLINSAELIGLTPPEPAPADEVTLDLAVADMPLVVRARLGGRAVRKAEKAVAQHGPDGCIALLQGNLKSPAAPGEPYQLDGAGLSVQPKLQRPAEGAAREGG